MTTINCTPEVTVLADSTGQHGVRLTTIQLRYWRAIHAEVLTHRAFSRNAGSSRARPTMHFVRDIHDNGPWGPRHWGKLQPGMQAHEELPLVDQERLKRAWFHGAQEAARRAEAMHLIGLHKQAANRPLEPFSAIDVVVTATDWDNFFALRIHDDAQPEIRDLAEAMKQARDASWPSHLTPGEWHLPYITDRTRAAFDGLPQVELAKISAARCARVSYTPYDSDSEDIDKDLALYEQLAGADPMHASPLEHAAMCGYDASQQRNFRGWIQLRIIEEANKRENI